MSLLANVPKWQAIKPRGQSDDSRGKSDDAALEQTLRQIGALQAHVAELKNALAEMKIELDRIHVSDGWRLLNSYYKLRNWVLPAGSKRHAFIASLFSGVRCLRRAFSLSSLRSASSAYQKWIANNEPAPAELDRQRRTRFACSFRISIVATVHSAAAAQLTTMIDSVLAQTYTDWELCLSDGNSDNPEITRLLIDYYKRDPRIRVVFLPENLGIAGNAHMALKLATGSHVAFLNDADVLAPFALYEIVDLLNKDPAADFLYADEDWLDQAGQRSGYDFKPDWSPDLLRSRNFIGGFVVLERELLARAGSFQNGFAGANDYDLALRATEQARKIRHIPKVLHHRRALSPENSDSFCASSRRWKITYGDPASPGTSSAPTPEAPTGSCVRYPPNR